MLKWLNTLKNNAETCLSFCFTEKTKQIRMTVTNRPRIIHLQCNEHDKSICNTQRTFQTQRHPRFLAGNENNKYKPKDQTNTEKISEQKSLVFSGSGVAFDGLQHFNSSFFCHFHQHCCFQCCIYGATFGLWQWQCSHSHGEPDDLKVTWSKEVVLLFIYLLISSGDENITELRKL